MPAQKRSASKLGISSSSLRRIPSPLLSKRAIRQVWLNEVVSTASWSRIIRKVAQRSYVPVRYQRQEDVNPLSQQEIIYRVSTLCNGEPGTRTLNTTCAALHDFTRNEEDLHPRPRKGSPRFSKPVTDFLRSRSRWFVSTRPPPVTLVERHIGRRQRVTIRTEHSHILRMVVCWITVLVVDLQRDLACHGISFGPLTLRTGLSTLLHQIG